MNLQSFKGTPDSQKLRFKGSERKLPLGAPVFKAGLTNFPSCKTFTASTPKEYTSLAVDCLSPR